jgi:hypothetical protein
MELAARVLPKRPECHHVVVWPEVWTEYQFGSRNLSEQKVAQARFTVGAYGEFSAKHVCDGRVASRPCETRPSANRLTREQSRPAAAGQGWRVQQAW